MGLVSEGINDVRAFKLPAGVWADGESSELPRSALVQWTSRWIDKFYQVYVNGRFAGATTDTEQREMIVLAPSSFESSVRIEIFAVDAGEADVDFSCELADSRRDSGRVKISLLRSQQLPIDARAEIYSDGGSGQIDYQNDLTDGKMLVWPDRQDKAGFGLSRFGTSDFGRDWSSAVGFGGGCFGLGEFGADADAIEWVSEQLSAGEYKFGMKIIDGFGNESAAAETGGIVVLPGAKGAEGLEVLSFDEEENKLELQIQN
jgi:hypothetical protein